jgi:hypothetical protein
MDIQGKTVLVLGGWGLVGAAICHKFMEQHPRRIIMTSLARSEALEAVAEMRAAYPRVPRGMFVPWWGNIFVRETLKDMPREEILRNRKLRAMFIDDILEDLTDDVLRRSSVHRLMQRYKPDIVVDCINSATAIAYQDIFQVSRDVVRAIRPRGGRGHGPTLALDEAAERLLCTLYVPQLIRHVQLMYRSMHLAGTSIYVKIGTSGTGGMGLNIPYTHSEERPSRVLLSKSAVAGAHTLLLFLLGRTPDAPIIKEIKPAAAIAWKQVAYGEIRKRGVPIRLVDCDPDRPVRLTKHLTLKTKGTAAPTGATLRSVYIDTGENGLFSKGEFEAISTPGQMEFVTPEEIAESTVYEVRAGNTGHDIINALDNATLAPTYRAGFMFTTALNRMKRLEQEHGVDSVAFEMLGPPRLSKLLFEAYLLKLGFGDVRTVLATDETTLSRTLHRIVREDAALRSQIISIGIPILLPDGTGLLRGDTVKIPPGRGEESLPVTPRAIDRWAHDGWVDLRVSNMRRWRKRFRTLAQSVLNVPPEETSSRTLNTPDYWNALEDIEPGKICGWIFSEEEKGKRMKA